ncbi:EthD domain-containing protein [Phenylobacterium sp.]|uniref:EthD domain-containing protein n=1 Tax=Phenylobacterium sp. TaxID=1871053 RepID=UPI0025F7E207|nr:EthD domain-containing protein [Phenylobacterium sp.]
MAEEHGPLVRRLAGDLMIQRYVQSHLLQDDRLTPLIHARSAEPEPYDGVAELWWRSLGDIFSAAQTEKGLAASQALLADERTFIDLPRSPLFFANEHEILSDKARPAI